MWERNMHTYWAHWKLATDTHQHWLRQAANERLARESSDDPDRWLPGDVAWVVNAIKAVGRWLASGLGNPPVEPPPARYRIGRQQKHGV
jgi:hypothetical protein